MGIFKNISDEHFKILKWIIIFWTVFSLIISLLTILSIETMVEVFFNQYNLNNTLQLNNAYKAANKPMDERAERIEQRGIQKRHNRLSCLEW